MDSIILLATQIQPSERRLGAARAGDRKSITPALAGRFPLSTEDPQAFMDLRDVYIRRFGPRDLVEQEIVDTMLHAAWNARRGWLMAQATVNLHTSKNERAACEEPTTIENTPLPQSTEKFVKFLRRYVARMSREFRMSLDMLRYVQKNVPLPPPEPGAPSPADHHGRERTNEPNRPCTNEPNETLDKRTQPARNKRTQRPAKPERL